MPPMWDQEGIHDVFRAWRRILDEYDGQRILCAEAWLPPERAARIRPSRRDAPGVQLRLPLAAVDAAVIHETVDVSLAANDAVGAPTTWVLSNHDVMRHASRFGYDGPVELESGVGADDPQRTGRSGCARARAATLVMLGLPGSAYLYQGEELGLPRSPRCRRGSPGPVWETLRTRRPRSRRGVVSRCLDTGRPVVRLRRHGGHWLPQPDDFGTFAVSEQSGAEDSTLELYRAALALRRSSGCRGWAAPLAGGTGALPTPACSRGRAAR